MQLFRKRLLTLAVWAAAAWLGAVGSAHSQLMLELGLGPCMQAGSRTNAYRFGFGGDILARYRFEKPFAVGATVGYYVNRVDEPGVDGYFRFIPLAAQAEYYFSTKFIRPYAGLELGGYFALEELGRTELARGSDFGVGPYAGMFLLVSPSIGLDLRLQYRRFVTNGMGRNTGVGAMLVGVVVPVTSASREHTYDY